MIKTQGNILYLSNSTHNIYKGTHIFVNNKTIPLELTLFPIKVMNYIIKKNMVDMRNFYLSCFFKGVHVTLKQYR